MVEEYLAAQSDAVDEPVVAYPKRLHLQFSRNTDVAPADVKVDIVEGCWSTYAGPAWHSAYLALSLGTDMRVALPREHAQAVLDALTEACAEYDKTSHEPTARPAD